MNPELQNQINQHITQTVEKVHESYRNITADLVRQVSEFTLREAMLQEQLKALDEQLKELREANDTLTNEKNELEGKLNRYEKQEGTATEAPRPKQ